MAEQEDLDLDAKPASSKKMIIIMALVGLLLVGGSVGVTVMLLGGDEEAAGDGAAIEEPVVPQTHYLALDKMVITFSEKGSAKFLQVEMQLMAHDPAVLEAVQEHMPVVKNNLLLLLSAQTPDPLREQAGKEDLQMQILTEVQKIVKENNDLDGPQAVYFTSFVMQ